MANPNQQSILSPQIQKHRQTMWQVEPYNRPNARLSQQTPIKNPCTGQGLMMKNMAVADCGNSPPPPRQGNYIMNFTIFKQLSQFLQKSLEFFAWHSDNNATTKHITALPSRHSLAIFTPTVSDNSPTGVNISSLQDTDSITSYGGVMGVNTRPKGNSPSRLCAVVEPCHPLLWVVTLTKHIGAFAMNAITHTISNTISKFSIFTPVESLVLGFVLGLPIACFVIGILAIMGV